MSYSEKHKNEFLDVVYQVCDAIRGMPLDNELTKYLNIHYGPSTDTYQTLSRLLRLGVEEGWVAYVEVAGPSYRRGRIAEVGFNTAGMSIESGLLCNVKGQYHCHTKGEINMIIPLEPGANFCGTTEGWRVFEPMSEHFPTVEGKALIMFFLPDGAIEYKAPPSQL
ncbi:MULTISPECIES: 4-hydroxylaminobenzoate lyase [unclassified Serratia (in: enterobacteria)]|uniref:4-hydroxylaminobenzoate lyase n=1 Tax=unclassified Serratia (in: enterobacteria) TaxID=2647522 RepID=UPI0030765951